MLRKKKKKKQKQKLSFYFVKIFTLSIISKIKLDCSKSGESSRSGKIVNILVNWIFQ